MHLFGNLYEDYHDARSLEHNKAVIVLFIYNSNEIRSVCAVFP